MCLKWSPWQLGFFSLSPCDQPNLVSRSGTGVHGNQMLSELERSVHRPLQSQAAAPPGSSRRMRGVSPAASPALSRRLQGRAGGRPGLRLPGLRAGFGRRAERRGLHVDVDGPWNRRRPRRHGRSRVGTVVLVWRPAAPSRSHAWVRHLPLSDTWLVTFQQRRGPATRVSRA